MADDGLTFEAWSMPHVGALTKKFNFTKWVESYAINHRYSDLCDGFAVLADDMPTVWRDKLFKIDEANHANDAGSMVRVLRGASPVIHYIVTRSEEQWSDETPRQKLTFEGLEWILDRALVPHYDHPADPTVEPDWIYGADTLLANPTLEDSPQSKEVQHFSHTQTSSTYTITYSGQTTSALNWNDGWFEVHQALEALSNIQDVVVTGEGTAISPFEIEFLDPAGNAALLTTTATGASITVAQEGGIPDPAGWTKSFHPQTGVEHGNYTTFEVSSDQNHTAGGTYSLKVVAGPNSFPTDYPGVQQIQNVTGGRTYRVDLWVYPTTAMDFRLIVRTMDETAIDGAVAEGTLTANTWNHLVIDPFVVPKHISQVIVRLGLLETGGGTFYVDDGTFAPGFPEATLGRIFDDVLTAAIAVGSPLSWLSPTWSTTLDSAGDAWDQDLKWKVNHDQSFLQLFEYMKQWNYEWQIRWDDIAEEFQWDMFNPTAGGQVRTGIAIVGKGGTTAAAPIVKRPPGSTYVRVEGELGRWGENASATLDDVWGRLERAVNDRQGVDSAELDVFAARLVDREGTDTAGRSVMVEDPTTLPWEHYVPGDTVVVNMAPKDTRRSLRVVAIVASKSPDKAIPTYEVHFVSPVLSTEAAMAQGLRTLWRKFNAFRPNTPAATPQPSPIINRIGADTAIVIAAHNTDEVLLPLADYVCSGTDDQDVISGALVDQGPDDNDDFTGAKGVVKFLSGDYYFDDRLILGDQAFGKLEFKGEGMPIWHLRHNTITEIAAVAPMILCQGSTLSPEMQLRFINLHFEGGNHSNGVCFAEWTTQVKPWMHVESCYFSNWDQHIWWSERTVQRIFRNNFLTDCDVISVMHMEQFAQGPILVTGNIFQNCTGNFISGGAIADNMLVHGNLQDDAGSIVLNAVSLVTYADNVGF